MYLWSILTFKNTSYIYGTFFNASLRVYVPPACLLNSSGKGTEWLLLFHVLLLCNPVGWTFIPHVGRQPWITQISHRCWHMSGTYFVWVWTLDMPSLYNNVHILKTVYCILPLFEVQNCLNLMHLWWSESLPVISAMVLLWWAEQVWVLELLVKRCGLIKKFYIFILPKHSYLSVPPFNNIIHLFHIQLVCVLFFVLDNARWVQTQVFSPIGFSNSILCGAFWKFGSKYTDCFDSMRFPFFDFSWLIFLCFCQSIELNKIFKLFRCKHSYGRLQYVRPIKLSEELLLDKFIILNCGALG